MSERPAAFFEYWRSLCENPSYKDRVIVYVYSSWPVMREGMRQLEKALEWFPYEDLARKFGCGDYHLKLNDIGMSYQTVCACTVRNVGDRNLMEFPPVRNPEGIEISDPLNRSYVEWCRSRGIELPGDDWVRNREDEENMANVEAVRELTRTVRDLTDKATAKKEREPLDPTGVALVKGMEVISDATRQANEIIDRGVQRALEVKGQQQNPVELLRETAAVIKDLIPPVIPGSGGGGMGEAVKLMEMMMERDRQYVDKIFQIQTERIAFMEKAQVSAPPPAPPKGLKEQLEEMRAMKDTLRDVLGMGEMDEDSKPARKEWTEYIPQILQGLTALGTVIGSAIQNVAVARTGQGTPAPVPAPAQVLTPEQMAAAAQGTAGVAPGSVASQYGTPGAPGAPGADGGITGANTMERFNRFLDMIQVALLRSFQEGESGADFAAKLIELTDNGMFGPGVEGRQIYDGVLEFGELMVGTLIKTHAGIWSVVSQTPQKWERFLHEFFTADQIWAEEDRRERAEQREARRAERGPGAGGSEAA